MELTFHDMENILNCAKDYFQDFSFLTYLSLKGKTLNFSFRVFLKILI